MARKEMLAAYAEGIKPLQKGQREALGKAIGARNPKAIEDWLEHYRKALSGEAEWYA